MKLNAKWSVLLVFIVAVTAIVIGCAAKQPVEAPKPAPHVFSLAPLDIPVIFNTPADATALCDNVFARKFCPFRVPIRRKIRLSG